MLSPGLEFIPSKLSNGLSLSLMVHSAAVAGLVALPYLDILPKESFPVGETVTIEFTALEAPKGLQTLTPEIGPKPMDGGGLKAEHVETHSLREELPPPRLRPAVAVAQVSPQEADIQTQAAAEREFSESERQQQVAEESPDPEKMVPMSGEAEWERELREIEALEAAHRERQQLREQAAAERARERGGPPSGSGRSRERVCRGGAPPAGRAGETGRARKTSGVARTTGGIEDSPTRSRRTGKTATGANGAQAG